MVKIVECPRDAIQGYSTPISTQQKVKYYTLLDQIGFDTLDMGSFVSVKAVPQMADTDLVLELLGVTKTPKLVIIANQKGAALAAMQADVEYIGYPLSVSETFQLKNTRRTIEESLEDLDQIKQIAPDKKLVIYLSMAFGNPYKDAYDHTIVLDFLEKVSHLDPAIVSLADTTSEAGPTEIEALFHQANANRYDFELGLHLHAHPDKARAKIQAAVRSGCQRIDAAIGGWGGCPFAKDELTGNIATEQLVQILEEEGVAHNIDREKLKEAVLFAQQIFR